MDEKICYSGEELEWVLNAIMNLEERIEFYREKTGKPIVVQTRISYSTSDDYWVGVLEVSNAKEDK